MRVIHLRHGATKNSVRWSNMGEGARQWYLKHGQFRSLCWTPKSSIRTSDELKDVTCKKCLSQYNG